MPDLISHVEGSLVATKLKPPDALRELARWREVGIKRVLADPALLQVLYPLESAGMVIVGSVGSPTGCHTLGTKRMEALECLRLGAAALEFFLNPYMLLSGSLGETEKEISLMQRTTQDVEMTVATSWPMADARAQEILIRILRALRPQGLKLLLNGASGDSAAGLARDVSRRLHRKTFLSLAGAHLDLQSAAGLIEAGCRWVQIDDPENFLNGAK